MDTSILNHPAFAGMSPEKLQFLMSFLQKDKPTNMRDVLPFLMSNMNLAKQQNLDFSKPEVQMICELLCKDLPPAEQERMRKIMALMQGTGPGQK
ncbi:MAG: hypothetical protein J1D89_02590 [Agathobacter sp.]|nr:hypothetical protein [Agathobacter sp.]